MFELTVPDLYTYWDMYAKADLRLSKDSISFKMCENFNNKNAFH